MQERFEQLLQEVNTDRIMGWASDNLGNNRFRVRQLLLVPKIGLCKKIAEGAQYATDDKLQYTEQQQPFTELPEELQAHIIEVLEWLVRDGFVPMKVERKGKKVDIGTESQPFVVTY